MSQLSLKARTRSIARLGRDTLRRVAKDSANALFGYRALNIGGGREENPVGWWCADFQTGFVVDAKTVLPFRDQTISFAYSSMFFEHIDDAVAGNLLREVRRVLKPGAQFRIALPNFSYWIKKYHEGQIEAFGLQDPNLVTWERLGVPIDIEHLLVQKVASLHNLPHRLTIYPHQENPRGAPPVFTYPFQQKFDGYYCGPAPDITTQEIRERLKTGTDGDFFEWVFEKTAQSPHQDPTFNSWHKNWWNTPKMEAAALKAGYSKCIESGYGMSHYKIPASIEREHHTPYALYYELTP